jgi:hypothetical protein
LAGHQSPRHILRDGTAWGQLASDFIAPGDSLLLASLRLGTARFFPSSYFAGWDHRLGNFKGKKVKEICVICAICVTFKGKKSVGICEIGGRQLCWGDFFMLFPLIFTLFTPKLSHFSHFWRNFVLHSKITQKYDT